MESDFRTRFRNAVDRVKVHKEDTSLVVESSIETADVANKIDDIKLDQPKNEIEEIKKEEIIESNISEQEEFESLELNNDEILEIKN